MNEAKTRKEIIDFRFKQSDWIVSEGSQEIKEFDIIVDKDLILEASTPYAGYQYSNYVLLGKDGKSLAVIEAKKHRLLQQSGGSRLNNIAAI